MSGWYKPRKPIQDYPKTDQQKKIEAAGKAVGQLCKGKKKGEFYKCRHEVLECLFHGYKCSVQVMGAVKEIEEQQKKH